MQKPPVRTITLGLEETHPLPATKITQAASVLKNAQKRFNEAGYEVQTIRLSTRPLFDDLADWSTERIVSYVLELQKILDEVELGYCSLGPAQAAQPTFKLRHIELIPELLATTHSICLTTQLADRKHGLREEAALPIAHAMKRLANETSEGFGNFNFAMLACVDPGTPFFPAAYHNGPATLSLGLQGASIIRGVAENWQKENRQQVLASSEISTRVQNALEEQARPIVALGQELASEYTLQFGGIDLSPAPMGGDSITSAIEAFGYGILG
ncbi:MAG TPA: DUF711 family protein, partial [Ktedonobacteraceae bacterium]|nr:DUF711 family protein [Ktedonobacteraceae bacterium]